MAKKEVVEQFVPRDGDRLLLLSISDTIKHLSPYDATRYAWRVSRARVERHNDLVVLGCADGIVQGVFLVSRWLDASPGEATEKNFPGFSATHKGLRLGFEGAEADAATQRNYLGKFVPDELAMRRNPVRYHLA